MEDWCTISLRFAHQAIKDVIDGPNRDALGCFRLVEARLIIEVAIGGYTNPQAILPGQRPMKVNDHLHLFRLSDGLNEYIPYRDFL